MRIAVTLLLFGGAAAFASAEDTVHVSLEHRIAQMLIVGFRGLTVDDGHPIVRDIVDGNLGGVILFDRDMPSGGTERNIRSPAQVKALNESLSRRATTPLFVSVDQEGGFVARLKTKYGFPATLSALKLAALPQEAFDAECDALARTLADAGFNLNFAPSVDVNVNPESPAIGKWERSFSADPTVVAQKAIGMVEAHRRHHVLTVLKHFPGHGSSRVDSHLGLTDVSETWLPLELEPYRALVKADRADAVMTAHVFHRGLDAEHPATLSKKVIGETLRKEIGFDGVIFTDDLQMGAITQHYGFEKSVELAILAGADVLTFGNNLVFDEHITAKVVAHVVSLVRAGTLTEARIDASYERIQRLKSRLALRSFHRP